MEHDPTRIAEQAAEYYARRAPGARPPGRDGLEAWLRADARHVAAYDETRRVWSELDPLGNDADLQALMREDLRAARRLRHGSRCLPMAAAAAVLAVVLGGGGYFYAQRLGAPAPVAYATALGEQRTEVLADGSRMMLNTATAVQACYTRDGRLVELQQGEAQFDVTRDTARPFTVRTGDARVTALGTRFQVLRDADRVRVVLLEGQVEVTRGDERRVLAPNQQAIWRPGAAIQVLEVDPETATAWLQGRLRFSGTPLVQVIAEANRYSAQKLRLGDSRLADVELSGVFVAGDNASIAAAAALILPVRLEERGEQIVLLSK